MRIEGSAFKDDQGRTLLLRGANLGGSSKVPFRPNGATHIRDGFFDHRDVSFVGRPFPLEKAGEHLARLRAWGFNVLRLLVTWEAVEHAGPGLYDQDYLDYLCEVVRKAGEHGLDLFVDPHQDVWSRMSGGDGAPGWTFEAVGMDVARFAETGAAVVHATHGDPFPRMIWPTNAAKLASATLFTLFFGGTDFCPRTHVDGEPAQEFLQRHYVNAILQVVHRLKGLPNVLGYESMNEPSSGWIGWPDLATNHGLLRLGCTPTPFQAMLLGAGFPQEVDVWKMGVRGARRTGQQWVNPAGVPAWHDGVECPWRENGVWDVDGGGQPRLLRPHHFAQVDGRSVSFNDYLSPFLQRYARAIRSVDPGAMIFLEGVVGRPPPRWDAQDVPNAVHAAHWYDGLTLFTKKWIPFLGVDMSTGKLSFGQRRVRRAFARQLARIKADSSERMGGIPTLIGEFGIPFDLRGKRAYRTGNFSAQVQAMDRSFRALEANQLSGTVWNYTADNDNRRGDQWNDEDLSIYSRDQQANPADLNSGGRALEAIVRPYARKVAGEPLEMSFDRRRRVFDFAFRHDAALSAPTEVYVPRLHYPGGCRVEVSDGDYTLDANAQVLLYHPSPTVDIHRIRLSPR